MRPNSKLLAALFLGIIAPASAQTIVNPISSSGGAVSITSGSANIVVTPSPLTGTGTIGATFLVDPRTTTTEAINAGDAGKLVTFSNASAVAVSLPAPTGSFAAGWSTTAQNKGAGTVTITPASGLINGGATLTLAQNTGCDVTSDGTNYQISACTAVGGGVSGVSSITGTANQIAASASTGAVTLSLPAAVQTTSLALNGCTIGTDGLCVTGTASLSGVAAIGGVNLTSATIPTNGWYLQGANSPGLSTNGTLRAFATSTGSLTAANAAGWQLCGGTPTGTSPCLIPRRDANTTGISGASAGVIDLVIVGVDSVRLGSDGLRFLGTIPTVTGTGSPTIATGSTDTAGEVTAGATAISVVITFAASKTNAPFCIVTPQTQLATFAYTVSTTAITITQAATSGDLIDYHCFQH